MLHKQIFLITAALLCGCLNQTTAQWWLGNNDDSAQNQPAQNNGGLFGGFFQNPFAQTTTEPPQTVASRQGAAGQQQQRPNNQNNQQRQQNPYETNTPCIGQDVSMTRPAGDVTPQTNFWMGHVDLSNFAYLKSIKLVIKVDNPARIEVNAKAGRISGPRVGTTFRVSYFGEPPAVKGVNFKIVGTDGAQFPNLESLHLNNRDICKGAVAVSR